MAIDPTNGGHDKPPTIASSFSSRRANSTEVSDAVTLFRRWVMSAVARPSVHEDMLDRVAHCRSNDISEMVEVIDRARQVCVEELQELHSRWHRRNELDASSLNAIALTAATARCSKTIAWLEEVRLYLKEELQQHERAAAQQRCSAPIVTELSRS